MNVKPNIGIVNALIRITCGLTMLAWSTAKYTKNPWRESYLVMAILGAMKVGEGITRFCPIVALFERSQENHDHKRSSHELDDAHDKNALDQFLPYNPS